MKLNRSNRKTTSRYSIIILLSCIGIVLCIAVLFPQVRQMIMDMLEQILHRKAAMYESWFRVLLSCAMGGICFILFFDYCTLTASGKMLVQNVKQEIKDCLSEIDFSSFVKPLLLMSVVYLLGILTIIRADFFYLNDFRRAIEGARGWYNWSRYVSEFASIFVHADTNLTDISPLPQLLTILIASISSVLLVYIIGNKKMTTLRLLASIPLGLSPFFLECLVFKFDGPYMALSILISIIPFLFITRKKAFVLCSIVSLLIMCMTYQAASGVYLVIVVMLCFQDWNSRKKSNKEILFFWGSAAFAFCFAMILFRFFFMKPAEDYASTSMYPVSQIISGALSNIKNYILNINNDLGMIWKAGIVLVLLFFIIKSIHVSAWKKIPSFFVSISVIVISFILSYGVYLVLSKPLFSPRGLIGAGVLLSILCIYVASDYKKIATIVVLALNWCFLIFAFSYGNALADQSRYAKFRISILLNDLNVLYPDRNREDMTFQLKNSIDYAPSIKNIAKHYPVIERLVQKQLGGDLLWDRYYFLEYFNYSHFHEIADMNSDDAANKNNDDFDTLNLPVVLNSYYHTIQSDGSRVLIVLKH